MTDHKQKLTANLNIIRKNLALKHQALLQQVLEIEQQIEATDRLIKVHNPDHIALPVRAAASNSSGSQLQRLQLPPAPTAEKLAGKSTTEVSKAPASKPAPAIKDSDFRSLTSEFLGGIDKQRALLTVLNTMNGPAKTSQVSKAIINLNPSRWPEGLPISILNSRLSAILFRLYSYDLVSKTDHNTTGSLKISLWEISPKGKDVLASKNKNNEEGHSQ